MHGFFLFVLLLNLSKKDESNHDNRMNYFSLLKYMPKFMENLFKLFDNLQGTFRPAFLKTGLNNIHVGWGEGMGGAMSTG